jgi:hypothetical protein
MAWAEGQHVLQLYPDAAPGVCAGTAFVADGLQDGATVVVIGAREDWQDVLRRTAAAGVDAPAAIADGRLRLFGAHTILASDRPHETLQAILRFSRPRGGALRVVSRLTDLLWRRGDEEGALAVERAWNTLAQSHAFSLLCACGLDALELAEYDRALLDLAAQHSHLVPVEDCEAFDEAVGRAVADVLEPRLVRMVHALSAAHRPAVQLPAGVALLLWLKQHMPRTAEKVLARSRERWTEH